MPAEVVVLVESLESSQPTASTRDIAASASAARLVGCRVYEIPADFERCGTAENALCHIPDQKAATTTLWLGFIPSPQRYVALEEAARAKDLIFCNTLAQHQDAQEFDRFYPKLAELTPKSCIIESPEESAAAFETVGGGPVFVKGVIQSRKSRGWKACVAENIAELEILVRHLLELENRSRGRVVVRQLVPLRHTRNAPGNDFPLGREFRLFVLLGKIVGLGYYWEGDDPLSVLTPTEERTVRHLATEAAIRVASPYISVDIGQTETGEWIVIETGDAQFSGLSRVSPLILWRQIKQQMSYHVDNQRNRTLLDNG
jgi:hypothetical protein